MLRLGLNRLPQDYKSDVLPFEMTNFQSLKFSESMPIYCYLKKMEKLINNNVLN